jgi:sterol desaturase/sphingolipid hydroxylase (fatty acid hydroxylase superfamily)
MMNLPPRIQQQQLDWDEVRNHAIGGLEMSMSAVTVTLILELWSLESVRQVLKQQNGKELYITSIFYNLVNHFVLGIPTYMIAVMFFCSKNDSDDDEETSDVVSTIKLVKTWMSFLFQVLFILAAHSLQYYYVHKTFHESPMLYRTFHRFHHRFNNHVPPSAANAVTVGEYLFAYVLPFANAALIGHVTVPSLRCAIFITIVLNAVVHTPKLEAWSERWIPFFWVSTADHLNHHRKLLRHFASPLFNIDNILSRLLEIVTIKKRQREK